jgi:hypothetical protein
MKTTTPVSTKILILDNEHTEITREATQPQWDADDTSSTHSIQGFKVVTDKGHYTFMVPFKIQPERAYYLVYVLYSTGDSFHNEDGCINFIDMFENEHFANKVRRAIQDDYNKYGKETDNSDKWTITLPNPDGTKYSIHCSWKGYFESLESAHLEIVSEVR